MFLRKRFIMTVIFVISMYHYVNSQPQIPAVNELDPDRLINWQVAGLSDDALRGAARIYNVDNYTTIQEAIDDAIDETAGLTILFFPEGTYNIDAPILLEQNNAPNLDGSNIVFQGEGSGRTNFNSQLAIMTIVSL